MPAKIKSFEQFIESFKKSKNLNRNIFSNYELEQLKKFYEEFYEKHNLRMGKSPKRYLYDFINFNKTDSEWVKDIERIIVIGNKANREKMILMYGETCGNEKWNEYNGL